jgi:hypothetical protein
VRTSPNRSKSLLMSSAVSASNFRPVVDSAESAR